ncbi:acyl-CoA thioesterase [Hydrogenophaga crocea]|uniref:Acyl-CoA thioesterase n=1 Tax=Hydrogenophaga crocea TaxID=2716225 RepID=A0A6G8IMU9_9BURK|nr:acyl-CoA thioesterase [Hydrogenophaga crocea]QIM54310.1 acyl-CoA thioesterase [Hydrogenophaga crocea]
MLSHLIDLPESFRHGVPAPTPARRAIKTFRHSIDIYLKDSNAYGNTYFSRYFEWQGVCRERWFHQCISADMLQSLGVFITKRAHAEYLHESFPFQHLTCEVNTHEIRHCSFQLLFRFVSEERTVATGYQQIAFADHRKRLQRLPAFALNRMRDYEVMDTTPFERG